MNSRVVVVINQINNYFSSSEGVTGGGTVVVRHAQRKMLHILRRSQMQPAIAEYAWLKEEHRCDSFFILKGFPAKGSMGIFVQFLL